MTACCSLVWGVPAEKCQAIVYDMPYYNPRFNPLPPLCAPARSPFPADYDSGRPCMHPAQRLNRLTTARPIPQQAVDARHGGTLPAVFGVASGRAAGAGAGAAAKHRRLSCCFRPPLEPGMTEAKPEQDADGAKRPTRCVVTRPGFIQRKVYSKHGQIEGEGNTCMRAGILPLVWCFMANGAAQRFGTYDARLRSVRTCQTSRLLQNRPGSCVTKTRTMTVECMV